MQPFSDPEMLCAVLAQLIPVPHRITVEILLYTVYSLSVPRQQPLRHLFLIQRRRKLLPAQKMHQRFMDTAIIPFKLHMPVVDLPLHRHAEPQSQPFQEIPFLVRPPFRRLLRNMGALILDHCLQRPVFHYGHLPQRRHILFCLPLSVILPAATLFQHQHGIHLLRNALSLRSDLFHEISAFPRDAESKETIGDPPSPGCLCKAYLTAFSSFQPFSGVRSYLFCALTKPDHLCALAHQRRVRRMRSPLYGAVRPPCRHPRLHGYDSSRLAFQDVFAVLAQFPPIPDTAPGGIPLPASAVQIMYFHAHCVLHLYTSLPSSGGHQLAPVCLVLIHTSICPPVS